MYENLVTAQYLINNAYIKSLNAKSPQYDMKLQHAPMADVGKTPTLPLKIIGIILCVCLIFAATTMISVMLVEEKQDGIKVWVFFFLNLTCTLNSIINIVFEIAMGVIAVLFPGNIPSKFIKRPSDVYLLLYILKNVCLQHIINIKN